MINKIRIALIAALCALSLAALPLSPANALPSGPKSKAPTCAKDWSPWRHVNAKSSSHWMHFKRALDHRTYYLLRDKDTCITPNRVFVPRVSGKNCKVKQYTWNLFTFKYQYTRSYLHDGQWHRIPWVPMGINNKWKAVCVK